MLDFLKSRFLHDPHEDFLSLMAVAEEDEAIRQQLLTILKQSTFNRNSLLNTWVEELELQTAPSSLIQALKYLLTDDIAERALSLLEAHDKQKLPD